MSLPAPVLELPPVSAAAAPSAPPRPAWPHWPSLIAAAIALAAGLVAINTLPVGGFYDDAFYVILGKSLATGHGYRNLNLPGAPFATHYPPGYPLLLALLWRIGPAFPANLILFKVANAVLLAVAAAFAYRLGRECMGLRPASAMIATIAGTATTPALYLSSMLLSETMFLALLTPLLLWAEVRTRRRTDDVRGALVLGVCAGLLFLVRAQAIALVGAVALVYLLRRRWREGVAFGVAAGIVVAPWLIWVAAHDATYPTLMRGDYGSYFGWLADGIRERGAGLIVQTVRRNVPDMFAHVVHRLQPPTNPLPEILFSLGTAALAIAGGVRLVRRAPVTLLFLLAYLAIAAVWPFVPLRFVLGIWVILLLGLAAGAESLVAYQAPNAALTASRMRIGARVLGLAASALLLYGVLAYNVRGYSRHWWSTTQNLGMRWILPKLQWVRANTDSSAVIATDHDEGAVYLYTGRHAVPVTTFTAMEYLEPRSVQQDSVVMRALITHYDARYLVLASQRLRPAAAALSSSGIALADGEHEVVPWAFTLRR